MERIKINKRNRQRPNYLWSDSKIAELLKMIIIKINGDISQFEKPTRQVFYQSIIRRVPSLRTLDWNLLAHKMRNLKVSYFAAESLRDTAADIEEWNEQDNADQIKRKCPFYTLLRKIYGQQGNCMTDKENNEKTADDNADENENEENSEKAREDSLENCSETLLAYLNDDFVEVVDVKKEEQEQEPEQEPLSFENIVMTDAHNILPNRSLKHLWRDDETKALLETVLNMVNYDAEAFQKPTPQSFYEAILERRSEIRKIEWTVARSKMKNLRASYVAADLLLKQQSEKDLLDENSLNEEIRRVCPFFDLLHQIFKINTSLESLAVAQIKSDIKDNDDYNQSSEESEGSYPFEDEAEVLKINVQGKSRPRKNGVHRWRHNETKKLLKSVINEIKHDPDDFEKPTSQRFYTKIFPKQNWSVCKTRLRYLKQSYVTALEMREQQKTINLELDKELLKAQIRKVCPYWDLLHQTFGPQLKVKDDSFVIGSSDDDDDDRGDDDDDDGGETEKVNKKFISDADPKLQLEQESNVLNFDMQKEKLRLERIKIVNDLEIRKLELRHKFDIKKLELERDERLALAKLKLELESQERIKKYELDFKLKNNNKF